MREEVHLELLEQMLKTHDWFYHFSDDHRYYIKGRDSAQRIRVMMERLEELGLKTEANELYTNYRPEDI